MAAAIVRHVGARHVVITDVNEQTIKLTGYNRKQLLGSRFAGYFTDPDRATAGVAKTFEQGVVTNYELVVRAKGGGGTVVSLSLGLGETSRWLALIANVLVVGGLAPSVWLGRKVPVWRWVAYGVVTGVIVAWLALILTLL